VHYLQKKSRTLDYALPATCRLEVTGHYSEVHKKAKTRMVFRNSFNSSANRWEHRMDMVPKLDVEDLAHETIMTYNRQ
jgi:hypothetical protein